MFRLSRIVGNLAIYLHSQCLFLKLESRIFSKKLFFENIEAHKRLKAITVVILPDGGEGESCIVLTYPFCDKVTTTEIKAFTILF